jgi:hypothetical protein
VCSYVEDNADHRIVKIPTLGVSSTEFDLTEAKKLELYVSGYTATKNFLLNFSWDLYKAARAGKDQVAALKSQPSSEHDADLAPHVAPVHQAVIAQ